MSSDFSRVPLKGRDGLLDYILKEGGTQRGKDEEAKAHQTKGKI